MVVVIAICYYKVFVVVVTIVIVLSPCHGC
jgi:hypothetical protein